MDGALLLRAALVGVGIAGVETLHGIGRTLWVAPRIGAKRSRQWGVLSGSFLIAAVAWAATPYLAVQGPRDALLVGAIWVGIMLALDIGLGRLVMRMTWSRVAEDFDPRRGGMLGLGMVWLAFAPLVMGWTRGVI